MKQTLLIMSLLFFFGCELHKQNTFLKGKPESSKFKLESLDKMFALVLSDDYFSLEKLLIENMDLNILNNQGQNLLIEAVKLKRDLVAKLLLEHGADPQYSDGNNQTAYDIIDGFEDIEIWKALLEGNRLPSSYLNIKVTTLVSEAAEDTQKEVIEKLKLYFSSGADVNARNKRKYTLLILASSKNLPEIVTFLCETKGVDIRAKAGRYTALILTKKLLRRNPSLARIIAILESYEI